MVNAYDGLQPAAERTFDFSFETVDAIDDMKRMYFSTRVSECVKPLYSYQNGAIAIFLFSGMIANEVLEFKAQKLALQQQITSLPRPISK